MVQFSLMSVRRPITEWLIRVPALQWHQGLLKILEADMQASSSQLHKVGISPVLPERICTGTREPTSSFCCCRLAGSHLTTQPSPRMLLLTSESCTLEGGRNRDMV